MDNDEFAKEFETLKDEYLEKPLIVIRRESNAEIIRHSLFDGLETGAYVGGLLAFVIAGLGLGGAIAFFLIGCVYKLFTANIW
jgi:hypothetical protein